MYQFSSTSKKRMKGVDKRWFEITELALKISIIDFGIPALGGIRTADEQYKLSVKGVSNCDGYEKKSKHQSGKALDVYAYTGGKASWKESDLSLVACAMLQAASILGYKVEWGGHWSSFKDMPHFQIKD